MPAPSVVPAYRAAVVLAEAARRLSGVADQRLRSAEIASRAASAAFDDAFAAELEALQLMMAELRA